MQSVKEKRFEIEKVNTIDTNQRTDIYSKIKSTTIGNQNMLKVDKTRVWESKNYTAVRNQNTLKVDETRAWESKYYVN